MGEHESPPGGGQDGPRGAEADGPDEAREAELMRQVLRMQQRHREGGVDPELADSDHDPDPGDGG